MPPNGLPPIATLATVPSLRTMIVATHSPAVAARLDEAWRLVGGKLLPMPRPHGGRLQKQPRWTA